VNQVVHTNGITDTQTTDSSGIPRPGSISFSGFAGIVGNYSYDGAANVKQIGSHRYSYDLESRITFSNLGSLGTQGFSYDRYGNRTRIVKAGVAYDYPAGPSTNRLTGNGAVYDDAGNQVRISDSTIALQNYAYDPFNMMVSVQSSSYAANYIYTADDERFVEIDTSGSGIMATYTLRGLGGEVLRRFEHVWGTGWFWEKDYVHRGGSMLAAVTVEGVQHFHLDHLGTPRLITNSAGAEISRHTYFPFGEEANILSQDPERLKFTGHERDANGLGTSDDLDYMHARHCSPSIGRFLSIDPLSFSDLQNGNAEEQERFQQLIGQSISWNRYAYARGNPLKYIDPDGNEAVLTGEILLSGKLLVSGGSSASILSSIGPQVAVVGALGAGVAIGTGINQIPGVSETTTDALTTILDTTVFMADNTKHKKSVVDGLISGALIQVVNIARAGGPENDPDFEHHKKEIKAILERAVKVAQRLPKKLQAKSFQEIQKIVGKFDIEIIRPPQG
jgi:RHS repeat-associated protein